MKSIFLNQRQFDRLLVSQEMTQLYQSCERKWNEKEVKLTGDDKIISTIENFLIRQSTNYGMKFF
jgi:hypothetical protein